MYKQCWKTLNSKKRKKIQTQFLSQKNNNDNLDDTISNPKPLNISREKIIIKTKPI